MWAISRRFTLNLLSSNVFAPSNKWSNHSVASVSQAVDIWTHVKSTIALDIGGTRRSRLFVHVQITQSPSVCVFSLQTPYPIHVPRLRRGRKEQIAPIFSISFPLICVCVRTKYSVPQLPVTRIDDVGLIHKQRMKKCIHTSYLLYFCLRLLLFIHGSPIKQQ